MERHDACPPAPRAPPLTYPSVRGINYEKSPFKLPGAWEVSEVFLMIPIGFPGEGGRVESS